METLLSTFVTLINSLEGEGGNHPIMTARCIMRKRKGERKERDKVENVEIRNKLLFQIDDETSNTNIPFLTQIVLVLIHVRLSEEM